MKKGATELFGVELEFAGYLSRDKSIYEHSKELQNKLCEKYNMIECIVSDTSIGIGSDDGREIQLKPLSFNELNNNKSQIANLFIDLQKYNLFPDETAGMHIHYSLTKGFDYVVKFIYPFLIKLNDNLSIWWDYYTCSHAMLGFCDILDTIGFRQLSLDKSIFRHGVGGDVIQIKQKSNTRTLEFRMFESSMDPDLFMQRIHITKHIVDYLLDVSFRHRKAKNLKKFDIKSDFFSHLSDSAKKLYFDLANHPNNPRRIINNENHK
ncbi:MAG: hypothetical protein LBL75_02510 [Rickettsiales bacterium]|jgi:hypothetical protein|nr:hypothetical protein [Rickettsiales bacterium]